MKQQRLLYLGGIFALLLVVWLLFIRDTNPTTFDTAPDVEVPTDQVNRLTLAFPADTVEIERQGTRWAMLRPVPAEADSNTVTRFLQQLGDMSLDAPVTSDVNRHAYYGFDSTATRINVYWGEESVFHFTVSRQGPDYQSVYVQIGEDQRIYSTRQRITVQQTADRWRDRRITSLGAATVQSAMVTRPEGSYDISRVEAGWNINGQQADSLSVENWLRRFTAFNADGFYNDIPKVILQDASYQINFISTAGTTEQLHLMPTEDGLAIASSNRAHTYKLFSSRLDNYFPDPETFLPE